MANVRLEEKELAGVPWLVLRGEPRAAFRRLGEWAADRIRATVTKSGILPPLRERVATPDGAATLAAVREESRRHYPDTWDELAELAAGAGVAFDDLLLMNLRGDLGRASTGAGCTDLAYADGRTALIAHNEDGDARLHGLCTWLTLELDGRPSVAVWWYPGFVPANTFTATSNGLAWGADHITIPRPAARPGRHFVARGLQAAPDLERAIGYLVDHPSAGRFAYTMGQVGQGRPVVLESAGEASHRYDVDGTFCWHTNHLRRLDPGHDAPSEDSLRRGEVMERATVPDEPDAAWLLGLLTTPAYPEGVYKNPADAEGRDGTATLATTVVDLRAGTALLKPRDRAPVTLALDDLVHGVG
ncbi:MAG TPA: C45 family peptidase [Actinopolymorphaceae bacterium]